MVDYTREIQQATKTASSTPQIAAPANSLGADLVNLAGTGLQFFQQQQAKTELQELTQKQAQQQRMLSEGIMGFREQRQNLVNQKGMTRLKLAEYDKRFLSKYSPEMQYEIVAGTNKLTGTNLSSMSDSISQKQKEERAAAAEVATKRVELLEKTAKSLSSVGMSVEGLTSKSDEELLNLHLQGELENTGFRKSSLIMTQKVAQGNWDKMKKEEQKNLYLTTAIPQFRNSVSSDLLTTLDGLGGFGQAMELGSKEALMNAIQDKRRSIPQLLATQAQTAKDLGITLSLEQQNAFKQSAEEELKRAETLISDESFVKLFDAQNDRMLRDGLFKMAMSGKEAERGAAISALIMMSSNIPLGDVEKSAIAKITSKGISGNIKFSEPDDESTAKQKVNVLAGRLKAESIGGGYDDTTKEHNYKIVENVLLSTPTEVNAFAKAGGINKLAGAIAFAEGKNIPTDKYAVVEEALFNESYKRVGAAQMSAINTQSSRTYSSGTGRASDRIMVSTDVLEDFTLNTESGLLESVTNSYVIPDSVKQYNSYMKDLFKSFEVLGVDEGRIKDFKENAMKSMLIIKANNK